MNISGKELFARGNYHECQKLLELKLQKYGKCLLLRDKLVIVNNKLACQLKSNVTIEELEKIKQDFQLLWQLMSGLPVSHDDHVTCNIIVVCNLVLSLIKLWLLTGHTPLINEAIIISNEINVNERVDPFVNRLLQLKNLLDLINNGISFNEFLIKNTDFTTFHDTTYYEMYKCYHEGKYTECLQQFNPSISTNYHLLLAGNCHVQLGHYQLGLHYYKQCFISKLSSLHCLAAKNTFLIYQLLNNSKAELTIRELYTQLLRDCNENKFISNVSLLWMGVTGGVVRGVHFIEHWTVANYQFIVRNLEFKQYVQAATKINELLKEFSAAQLLPPNLPSSLSLALLLSHTHILSGNYTAAETTLDIIPVRGTEKQSIDETFVEIIKIWLKSIVLVSKEDIGGADHMTVTCLEMINNVLSKCNERNHHILLKLKQILLNNIAIFAISEKRLSHAHQLIVTSIGGTSLETTPLIVVYNYCLLLIKLGKLKESSQYWLQENNYSHLTKLQAKQLHDTLHSNEYFDILTKFSLKLFVQQ